MAAAIIDLGEALAREDARIAGLRKRVAEHGLVPGGQVIQIEIVKSDGSSTRELFRYDTGASVHAEWAGRGSTVNRAYVNWDGVTDVSLDCGD